MDESTTLSNELMKSFIQVDPRVGEIQNAYPPSKKIVNLPVADKLVIHEAAVKVYSTLNKRFMDRSKPTRACRYCGRIPAENKCSSCKEPYCNAQCQKTDWPAHRHFCAAHKKLLDTHESQILSKTTATTLREALHSYSTTSPIELFSALTASLGLFTPTPLSATHTLLIHLRYDPRSPDPSLRFLPTSLEILPHVDLRSRILASPRIAAGQGEFLNGLGEEAIRKREEFGGGRDDAVYAAAVFWCDEGWDESVVVTRFVELPIRGRKPDFKTQDSKRWEENYLRCMRLSAVQIKQAWGLTSPREDEFLKQEQ